MSLKTCNHCREAKKPSEFNWRYKKLGVRQPTCRECRKKQQNQWYKRNRESHKAKTWDNKVKRRDEARTYILGYLSSHHCIDCGESNTIVLEFDHVRGRKKMAVAHMAQEGYSLEAIRKEINKCEVRCANCHRIRTHKQKGWFRG